MHIKGAENNNLLMVMKCKLKANDAMYITFHVHEDSPSYLSNQTMNNALFMQINSDCL